MLVEVGPVPSGSVVAWVTYARTVVDDLQDTAEDFPTPVPADTLAVFAGFLDEWEAEARRCDTFRWSADVEPEAVEYFVHAWFTIAQRLAASAERRGIVLAPEEGEAFYQALVTAVLDALAAEGHGPAQFSDHVRSFWPGLEDRRSPDRHEGRFS